MNTRSMVYRSNRVSPRRAGLWILLAGSLVAANFVTAAMARNPADSHQNTPATAPATKAPAASTPSSGHSAPASTPAATSPSAKAPAKPSTNAPATKPTATPTPATDPTDGPIDATKALSMLEEGNGRWVAGTSNAPNTNSARRQNVADNGQKPFVSILTCADSRIPLERVFDRGVGEIFAVRVAGNVSGDSETGTLEYGLGHLNTPLLVVMGHTKCGAVGAAASGAEVHGKVAGLVKSIAPAVERAKRNNPSASPQEIAAIAVKENVWQSVFDLFKNSEEIRTMAASGKVKVVGAVYDISSGKVEFLGEHPWQSELLTALAKDQAQPDGHQQPAQATAPEAKPTH